MSDEQPVEWEDITIRVCKDEELKPDAGKWIEYMGVRYYAEAPKREAVTQVASPDSHLAFKLLSDIEFDTRVPTSIRAVIAQFLHARYYFPEIRNANSIEVHKPE